MNQQQNNSYQYSPQYIKQKLQSDPQFIKKSKINYFNCKNKGLHEGQKLILVCLDNECKNKGLICPVCRQQFHKNHQVIHIKIFLQQLQDKLLQKQKTQQIQQQQQNTVNIKKDKSLGQYLNKLQNSRKNIILNLQQSVKILAQTIKDIQKKIQDQYIRIRRIILSQKSFENKLPKIYTQLLNTKQQNIQKQQQIKQEIKKLTQLLQTNNSKIKQSNNKNNHKIATNIDNIVQIYTKNSDTCTTYLLSLMTELPKKFIDLPIKLKNIIDKQDQQSNTAQKIQYKFSEQLKASSILLSQDKKSVSILGPDQIGGIVFIQGKQQQNQLIRKINLKITSSVSDSISIGVGDVNKTKQINFIVQQLQFDGLYGICSMGINITDIQSPTFVFSQGDIIQIIYDIKLSKLIFGRRNGVEKQEIQLGFSQEQSKKFKFFTSLLLYGDSVQIVD